MRKYIVFVLLSLINLLLVYCIELSIVNDEAAQKFKKPIC